MSIKANTTKLEIILDKANSLPDDTFYGAFWDNFQNNRTDYDYAFYGWKTFTEIKPKYPIIAEKATSMFHNCNTLLHHPELTFSTTVVGYCMFNLCAKLKEVNTNIPLKGDCHAMFNYCPQLLKINKLIDEGVTRWTTASFATCTRLQELVMEGTVSVSIYFNTCTSLNKASITNVINILSSATSGQSCTFSKTAVNKAFETSEGANDGSTSPEWAALIATKSNWTIALV